MTTSIIPAKLKAEIKAFGMKTAIKYAGNIVTKDAEILRKKLFCTDVASIFWRDSHSPTPTPKAEVTIASEEIHQINICT